MKTYYFSLFKILIILIGIGTRTYAEERTLESPYYIYPRTGSQHIDLSKEWELSPEIVPITKLSDLQNNSWIKVAYPTSVQMAYFKAGKLEDPYKHMNARKYENLEQKVWYYKKTFSIPTSAKESSILLNFDGIDYFAKIWLNGELLGKHAGIFGGPVIDITPYIRYDKENELIIEVISANYGKSDFSNREPGKIIKGWFLTGGSGMEPFFNLGLWRSVRIEIVPFYHIERPFLFTKNICNNRAELGLSLEVFAGKNSKDYTLHPNGNRQISNYSSPKDAPQNIKVKDDIKVLFQLLENRKPVYTKEFSPYVIAGRCWMDENICIENPKLWYPNGLGHPNLYKANILLKVNNVIVDCIEFDFGIRTIEQIKSAGIRTSDRWQNWQFVINGKKIFVKGVNWMPVDALYDLTPEKYDWAVKMAKNAGIQLFRIWGSGLLESKEFYDACNKYGIMVWQDFCIANFNTPHWPQDVWEAQVCQNIFRLRNEPSLAVWCGGNEFNPYSEGNAASIGILERNLAIFDPTRCFLRTSPDAGSLHSYPDFDPVWYKKFDLIPYVAETGIHCITDPSSIREVVAIDELKNLSGMYEKDFAEKHPEFVEHFAEYNPSRVPRMLSRASHINNIAKPDIELIAEASQVGAGEFYQIMSESFQSNYPVTTGLMPWVYKRPWPVVAAIHLVDGYGQPSAPYYFLKRTYEPTHVLLDIKRLLWAPGEKFPIAVKVLNGVDKNGFNGEVSVEIFDHQFNLFHIQNKAIDVKPGTSVSSISMESWIIPDNYKQKFFFVVTTLYDNQHNKLSQTEYWPRTIKNMEDPDYYKRYTTEPVPWPTLNDGPWLKPMVKSDKTTLQITDIKMGAFTANQGKFSFSITNTGTKPSFMTTINITGCSRAFYTNDNFFWLRPGESKSIELNIMFRNNQPVNSFNLKVGSWNTKPQIKEIKL